jgi:hypothetical protein
MIQRAAGGPVCVHRFQPLSKINVKNVALTFGKSKHHSWWTRHANDCTWEAQRHLKKAVILGGNNPALLASYSLAPQPNNHHHHHQALSSSSTNNPLGHTANGTNPAYKIHLQPPSYYQTNPVDPVQRTTLPAILARMVASNINSDATI